ncbi:MAG: ATP-binding cassette domain-containing protein, partial [Sphaerochaetaceae bacterium]
MVMVIEGTGLGYSYEFDGSAVLALEDVDITIGKGEFVTILGQNGSGKSTLVKHLNALLPIQKGHLCVEGLDVRLQDNIWKLRRLCGMVFQNPDNQFVSSIVEEDIAFGLENYGVPQETIAKKVKEALHSVGMD